MFKCLTLAVLGLLALSAAALAQTNIVTNTIPRITVTAPDATASEWVTNTGLFRIARLEPTNQAVRVFYRLGGTASNGLDYELLPDSVEIRAGERYAHIVVRGIDDQLVEGTETVVLALTPSPMMGPIEPYRIGYPSNATVTIQDNDEPSITNTPPTIRITHPTDNAVLGAPLNLPIVAEARDENGFIARVEFLADADHLLGVVTSNAGSGSLTNSSFSLIWSNVPPGPHVLTARATDNQGAMRISEPVHITVNPMVTEQIRVSIAATAPDGYETFSNSLAPARPVIFTVRRDSGTNIPLWVLLDIGGTAQNGVDYRSIPDHVVIPVGSYAAEIVADPIDDSLVEGDETVVVALVVPPCIQIYPPPPECYLVEGAGVAVGTIHDNDSAPTNRPPQIAITQPTNGTVFVEQTTIVIRAITADPDGYADQVAVYDGTNKIAESEVSIHPGPVLPPGTTLSFSLAWSNAPYGPHVLTARTRDNLGAEAVSEPVNFSIVASSEPPVVTLVTWDAEAAEISPLTDQPENPALFLVTRNHGTNQPLVVNLNIGGTAVNGVDYQPVAETITIPAGSYAAHLYIEPFDDDLAEGTETVVVEVAPPVCLAVVAPPPGCYRVGEPHRGVANIRDNDPMPGNQPPRVTITAPPDGAVFAGRQHIPIEAVTVDVDGYAGRVEFFDGPVKIGEQELLFLAAPDPGTPIHFSIVWSNAPLGRHELVARTRDNLGAPAVSPPVHLTVLETNAMPTNAPIVNLNALDAYAAEGVVCFGADSGWGTNVWLCTNINLICRTNSGCITNIAAFKVTRSGSNNVPLQVFYEIGGTASNGLDYASLPGVVTIPAGERSAQIKVIPIDDTLAEPMETVVLRLIPPPPLDTAGTVEPPNYLVGSHRRAAAFIIDNDHPRPPTMVLPDLLFHLTRGGTNGFCYRVEVSTNLTDWSVLCTNWVTDGAIHFVDPDAPDADKRFYRVVPELNPPAE